MGPGGWLALEVLQEMQKITDYADPSDTVMLQGPGDGRDSRDERGSSNFCRGFCLKKPYVL